MIPFESERHRTQSYGAIVSRLALQDKVPWYRKPNLRVLYLVMFPTCLGVQMTSGFDGSMLNGLQAVPSWLSFFRNPHSASLGLMSAMYCLGGIFAVPFVPSVVDNLGRRYSIFFGSILIIFGAILQGAAQNFAMFIVARFILGLGCAFPTVAASSLVGELSHPKERPIMSSLLGSCWFIGSIIAAAVVLVTFDMPNDWGWRIPSFLQIIPSLLQSTFIWFLPESPRWLVSKGRGDEAYAILVKYHAEGDESSQFVKAEYTQIEKTLEVELRNAEMSWKEVLSTPGMRRRAIIASFFGLFTEWSGNGLISYFLSPILDNIGIHDNRSKNVINLSLSCWSLVNATFFALTVPRFPRRKAFLTCTVSLFVVFTAWTVASAEYANTRSKTVALAALVPIFLYSPAYNIGYNGLKYTFLVELFPFHVRARGLTIYQWWYGFAGSSNQFLNPIGIDNLGWKFYICYCVWIAFEVVFIYFMFPETSRRTLEELTFLYEEDQRDEVLQRIENEIAHEEGWEDETRTSVEGSEDQPLLFSSSSSSKMGV